LGAVYVNPETTKRKKENSLVESYDCLFDEATKASLLFENIIIMGDFNAHIGTTSEFTDEHYDLRVDYECLQTSRLCTCKSSNTNTAGHLLLDMAAAGPYMITTGRGKGDTGQASYVGYNGKHSSRPDHILMTPTLYNSVVDMTMQAMKTRISDHLSVNMNFSANKQGLLTNADLGDKTHVCDSDCFRSSIKWDPEKAEAYAEHIFADTHLKSVYQKAIDDSDVEGANSILKRIIHNAAREAGMGKKSACLFYKHGKRRRAGMRKAPWFDDVCKAKKAAFLTAFRQGRTFVDLKKDLQKHCRSEKRAYYKRQTALLVDKLQNKDLALYDMLKEKKNSVPTPIHADTWKDYLHTHFSNTNNSVPTDAANRSKRYLDGRDLAVPLGRGILPQKGGVGKELPDAFSMPSCSDIHATLTKYLSKMNNSSSPGFELFTLPFIKHATLKEGKGYLNILTPLVAQLFHLALNTKCIPAEWKIAKISPIHKRGVKLDPNNYRMIAVSGTLYRLYANVLRDIMTKWCEDKKKVPDTQYGFYPNRNTLQPMFILRHLIHAAKHKKPNRHPYLHAVFIDFSQAYDTVHRPLLWEHLEKSSIPTHLLDVLKQIYDKDEYVLIDGNKQASTKSTDLRGVKQGCPLSPLLFSLFINDVGKIADHCEGAITGSEGLTVTHMLYADDLLLTSNESKQLQKMLNNLKRYAAGKGLVVNVEKSQVVNFNTYLNSKVPDFYYDCKKLDNKDSFKYLGMMFDKHMNLDTAASQAAKSFGAAMRRVKELGLENRVTDRPHVMLWLCKTYAISAGMYGSQVWSTHYLLPNKTFQNILQVKHMNFLKRLLRVKNCTGNWAILRECAQEPLQFYWFRATANFWNSMIDANSITLRAIMKADVTLGNQGAQNCWARQFKDAMTGLDNEATYKLMLSSYKKIDLPLLRVDIRRRHQTVWSEVVGQDPTGSSKKAVTYHNWFGSHIKPVTDPRVPYIMPHYLKLALNSRVMRNVSMFRLRGHSLRCETDCYKKFDRSLRVCDRCACGEKQDEKHVVFSCTWDAAVQLRNDYRHIFANISDGDLYTFIHQHHVDTYKFVSKLMDLYKA